MARDDAHAVMHVHTKAGQAVSAQAAGLMPLTQTAMLIREEVAYHEYEGVATDLEERERLVEDIGTKDAMILRNHGTLTVGKTVADCFIKLYFLERACEAQVMALTAGPGGLYNPPQGTPEKAAGQGKYGLGMVAEKLAWPALLRKLDRIDPIDHFPGTGRGDSARRVRVFPSRSKNTLTRGLRRPLPQAGEKVTYAARIMSAAFSAIITVAALVLPETRRGITDASTTRRPVIPWTRNCGSTTLLGSSARPIAAVPTGW